MERVLLTGAAGGIGSGLRKLLKPLYKELRLSDLDKPADLRSDEPFAADLPASRWRRRSMGWKRDPRRPLRGGLVGHDPAGQHRLL
jgi:hypothetical protein